MRSRKKLYLTFQMLMIGLNKQTLFLGLIFWSTLLKGQTKDELKIQKLEIEKEIKYTTEILEKTNANKTKSLNYLKVLKTKIKNQEQLLITLNIEIKLLNKYINKAEAAIIETRKAIIIEEKNVKILKEEYAKMIYAAYKKKGSRNNIMFIISANDFNQAYKRMLYLKQYAEFRKMQALKISESQKALIKKKEKLAEQKERLIKESAEKNILVNVKKQELENVNIIKEDKQTLLKILRKSERTLKKRLEDQQKQSQELDQKIRKIIEEEIRKSREIAKKNNRGSNYDLTPESMALSSEFANNQGKLPWPLEKGVIISMYGKQKHIVFSGVETFNNGIDIATDKNSVVRSVFDGVVSRIFFIKGAGKAVLINHGEYFSVYSGLKDVQVKAGEKILAKEKLGIVITNEENATQLHFEIWRGYNKENPSNWLYNAD